MRVSNEFSSKAYKIVEARRDNTKGVLPEYRFISFMYTTDRIQVALDKQYALVDGKYFLNDYEIADKLKAIYTPSEIRVEDTPYDIDVKEHSVKVGTQMKLKDTNLYSITNRPYSSLMDEYNLKVKANEDSASKFSLPVGKPIELLSPYDYKLVQETLFKQAGHSGNQQFTELSKLTGYSATHKTLEAVRDQACYEGKMFHYDRTNGIRPIALQKEMFPFRDFAMAVYDAEEMFLRWFEKQVFTTGQ